MTEADWLNSTDPERMLDYFLRPSMVDVTMMDSPRQNLQMEMRYDQLPGMSDRKLRLFQMAINGLREDSYEDRYDEPVAAAAMDYCRVGLRGGISGATQAALLRDIFGNPWKPVRIQQRSQELMVVFGHHLFPAS